MGNYTPLAEGEQDPTFLERLRDSTKKAEGSKLAFCYSR
jgi:hypothetical protein